MECEKGRNRADSGRARMQPEKLLRRRSPMCEKKPILQGCDSFLIRRGQLRRIRRLFL